MKTRFATRQLFESNDITKISADKAFKDKNLTEFAAKTINTNLLFSFILGIDLHPRPMEVSEIENLGDFFTQKILLKEKQPLTLSDLNNEISNLTGEDTLGIRKMFLVAEGGQHHLNNPTFEMNARLVFTWQKNNSTPPDLLLSTVPVLNDTESLLQLIAWSNKDNSFHFFERKRGVWGWAGHSFHALNVLSRGKGPFDSHINGGLVMKELKFPWAHWHSQSSTISRANFTAGSEFNSQPLFAVLNGAEELESIVRTGVRRWTQSRIISDSKNSIFGNLPAYLRQVLAPTSVNLTSTSVEFHRAENKTLGLPTTFFMDLDGLEFAATTLDPLTDAVPGGKLELNGSLFRQQALSLNIRIETDEGISLKEDTHFCFLVPERAFEDIEVSRQLVEKGIYSARILLCLLMVDFSNPVESQHRASLLKYCPKQLTIENEASNFEELWIKAIRTAAAQKGSPESEFLSYWDDTDLLSRVQTELHSFFDNIQRNLADPAYIINLLKLAEYRKDFYRIRKLDDLDEFKSTTSRIDTDNGIWQMDKEGKIINA